jgi:PleD family two-component response regulator
MLPQSSHRPRIAVIDDDRTHLREVQHALEQAGYDPRTSPAWELASLFVAEAQPVLVILQSAPGSERRGWRVLDELKRAEETRSIPVLVCSAAAAALDSLRGTLHGYGVEVLPPQPSPRQLLGCVRRQLASQAGPRVTAWAMPLNQISP